MSGTGGVPSAERPRNVAAAEKIGEQELADIKAFAQAHIEAEKERRFRMRTRNKNIRRLAEAGFSYYYIAKLFNMANGGPVIRVVKGE
jgi:hypothetical protein